MRVSLPYNLRAMKQITAAQLKAEYDAIAAVLNGNIGRDNFAPIGAISKAMKAGPRAWLPLEGQLVHPFAGDDSYGNPAAAGSGPSKLRWMVPSVAPAARSVTAKLGSWSAWIGGTNGTSLQSGTIYLRRTPKATGIVAVVDSYAIPAATDVGVMAPRAIGPELQVEPGDLLEVAVGGATYNGGGTRILGFGAALWLRMDHLP
jgi:hypothetical protein